MNQVEENVLIPKQEYETLLEKVNSMDSNDSEFASQPSDKKSGPTHLDIKGDESSVPDLPVLDSPSKEGVKLEEVKSANVTPTKQADENNKGAVNADHETGRKGTDQMLDNVLDKVPSNLKDSVRLLCQYILEMGEDIIEWNKDLRFIHLKEIVPKSNIANIMSYVLEKNGKPPKGATLFTRSLKSIGISNPKSWVFSQMGGMMSPYEGGETTVSEKRSNDSIDGLAEHEPKKKVKKTSKGDKLKKLSAKWITL